MFIAEEDSPFGILPPELIVDILKNVDHSGKRQARLVCRRWQWILDDPESNLTRFKAQIRDELSLEMLLKSHRFIEVLQIGNIQKTDWSSVIFSNVCVLIREIILSKKLSGETVLKALEFGSAGLESLMIVESSMAKVKTSELGQVLYHVHWNYLSQLDLSVMIPPGGAILILMSNPVRNEEFRSQRAHIRAVEYFLQSAMIPELKTFRFCIQSSPAKELGCEISSLTSEFTLFVQRHVSKLKELNLVIDLLLLGAPRFSLSSPIFSNERQESISRSLKLESLRVQISHFDSLRNLVPQFLWRLDTLTSFTWSPSSWVSNRLTPLFPGAENRIQELIQSSKNTLVNADIKFCISDTDRDIFQLEWLEECKNLEELRLRKFHKVIKTQLRLPQVIRLRVNTGQSSLIGDGIKWVTRSFENIQSITITGLTLHNKACEWLYTLSSLSKLQEILYSVNILCSSSEIYEFETCVNDFCFKSPVFQLKSPGIIKIILK